MFYRPGTRLWFQLKQTVKRWSEDDGSLLAAAMAYYAALSFFPLLLIFIAALGIVLHFSSGAQDAQQELLKLLAKNSSAALAGHVANILAEIQMKAAVGGPLGLFVLLLTSAGIFTHFETALDRIWNVKRPRSKGIVAAIGNILFHRLRAFLMLLGVGFLVAAVFVGQIVASAVRSFAVEWPGGPAAWSLFRLLAGVGLNCLLFAVVYKVLPRARVQWSAAVRGGVVAAVLWELARQVLAVALLGKKYTAYGVVSSLIVLMLWVYVASSVLLLGAEYIRVISDGRERLSEEKPR